MGGTKTIALTHQIPGLNLPLRVLGGLLANGLALWHQPLLTR